MMREAVLVFVLCVLSLSVAQDCLLPNKTELESALVPLLLVSDGPQSYSPNVTEGSVQYVCKVQGSMINTYQEVALIATFTHNPGQAETTRIMSLDCNNGTWNGVTNDGLPAPPPSVVGVTRTDCFRCRSSFGTDRCGGKPIKNKNNNNC